jgi:hypothetical protein
MVYWEVNMFRVYSGAWRGVGEGEKEVRYMQIGFDFRDHLHHFKSSSLPVFMDIVLHSDTNGLSYPSYDTIEQETGLSRDTIGRALDYLTTLVIQGQRVLLRYRLRNATTKKFIGGNRYITFPTEEQIQMYPAIVDVEVLEDGSHRPILQTVAKPPQSAGLPQSDNPDSGKSDLKKNQYKELSTCGAAAPAPAEPSSPEPDPEEPGRVDVHARIEAYPKNTRDATRLVHALFGLIPPERPATGEPPGEYGAWDKSIKQIISTSREYNVPLENALHRTRSAIEQIRRNKPITIHRPGSLIAYLRSELAKSKTSSTPLQGNIEVLT